MVVLTDPGFPNPLGPDMAAYGVDLYDAFVIDIPNALLGDPLTPIITRYSTHRITEQLGNLATYFPLARPIHLLDSPPMTLTVTSLMHTSPGGDISGQPNSWGDTALNELLQAQPRIGFNPADKDVEGPLNLAVAVEDTASKARLVVFGDSDFVSNSGLSVMSGQVGNADLFLNAVNWAAEEENLISVRSQPPTDRQIFLTGPQLRLIFLTTVLVLPLAVVVAGVAVWWRRR
jgi:ABC-type uncharacterized transport system involved in gliding motility auxiliary subunit